MRGVGRLALRPGVGPGRLAPTVRHFRPRGSSYILRSFPSILIYLPYCISRNFLFILSLFLFALCRELRARGRGGAHSYATTVAAAVHTQMGGMRVALSRNDIGLLAQPESVLSLAPPCGALVLASPPFGLVGARAAPPLFFFPFSFPFFPPLLVRCSR